MCGNSKEIVPGKNVGDTVPFNINFGSVNELKKCPVCEVCNIFIKGPSGGEAINIKCSACDSAFNYMPIFGTMDILSVRKSHF